MLKEKWSAAVSLEEFIDGAEANQDLWRAVLARAEVPREILERVGRIGQKRRLLVLLEDWCGDAVNTVPVVARLAQQVPGFELRVLRRDEHLDLMDAHLSGSARAIPVVIVLDERNEELGWWGSRPKPLQAWVQSAEAQAMDKTDRYRELRRWYARDRGRTTLQEITEILERSASSTDPVAAPARVA